MSEIRQRKAKVGVVISDKMNKTRVVKVDLMVLHPIFKKYYRRSHKFHVHDEKNQSQIGDTVEITECRPLSRSKRWKVRSVVRKAAA